MIETAEQVVQALDDAGLLARCREADGQAWRELFDAHLDFVHGVARRLGTPASEVEDVCQEVFVVVFRKLKDFDHGRFKTWLYRIVANVVNDRHRRRRFRAALHGLLEAALPMMPRAPTPDSDLDRQDAEAVVARILERMAPKKREVFALYELEQLSGDEIAERVGCKVDTVWTRLHYARKEFEQIANKLDLVQKGAPSA